MIGLSDDTKRRIQSVRRMIETDRLDRPGLLNLINKAKGKDHETASIMLRALSKAELKYQDYKVGLAMSDGNYSHFHVDEKDSWLVEDFLDQKTKELHNEKEFMVSVVAPELSTTVIQRDKEIRRLRSAQIKRDRAKALGLKVQGFKKALGLSR